MARETENTDVVKTMAVVGVNPNALCGMRIVITGHLSMKRDAFEQLIRDAGGTLEKSVTYGCHFLVTNKDWNTGSVDGVSSKFRRARDLGVKIISEQKLIEMMSVPDSPQQ